MPRNRYSRRRWYQVAGLPRRVQRGFRQIWLIFAAMHEIVMIILSYLSLVQSHGPRGCTKFVAPTVTEAHGLDAPYHRPVMQRLAGSPRILKDDLGHSSSHMGRNARNTCQTASLTTATTRPAAILPVYRHADGDCIRLIIRFPDRRLSTCFTTILTRYLEAKGVP